MNALPPGANDFGGLIDPAELIRTIEGPRLSIPVALVSRLGGDLVAAAMLAQAAYLSALSQKNGGWFDLQQTGTPPTEPRSVFAACGSWEHLLGIGPDAQSRARNRLKQAGLLHEARRGQPARLHYRVDPMSYVRFLAAPQEKTHTNPQIGDSAESRFRDTRQPVPGKRGIQNPESAESIPNRNPKKFQRILPHPLHPDELARTTPSLHLSAAAATDNDTILLAAERYGCEPQQLADVWSDRLADIDAGPVVDRQAVIAGLAKRLAAGKPVSWGQRAAADRLRRQRDEQESGARRTPVPRASPEVVAKSKQAIKQILRGGPAPARERRLQDGEAPL